MIMDQCFSENLLTDEEAYPDYFESDCKEFITELSLNLIEETNYD